MSGQVSPADAARAALAARDGGPPVAIVVATNGDSAGRRLLVFGRSGRGSPDVRGSLGAPDLDRAGHALGLELLEVHHPTATGTGRPAEPARSLAVGDVTLYAEVHRSTARLFVVGAGHIAVPLAEMGVRIGFDVVVLDDREAFATEERFPSAANVRRVDFADPFAGTTPGTADFVVLVTRAHRYDFDCLAALVRQEKQPRYVGMVGSRRRVRAAFGALLGAGVPRERLAAVHAPIGLDIGAETPEEIAVSIAAEIIAVRHGVSAGSLRDSERIVDRFL
ncbi:MAG TPA: XdhC family protein [Longimicrobiales bacterium]|nr:XdhC family protein [Longimicrobiales bacterium]